MKITLKNGSVIKTMKSPKVTRGRGFFLWVGNKDKKKSK